VPLGDNFAAIAGGGEFFYAAIQVPEPAIAFLALPAVLALSHHRRECSGIRRGNAEGRMRNVEENQCVNR